MTDTPLNGTPAPDPLATAGTRFGVALVRSMVQPNGQFGVNMPDMVVGAHLTQVTLELLVDVLVQHLGLDGPAWREALIERLNAKAAALEGPRIAVAHAAPARRS